MSNDNVVVSLSKKEAFILWKLATRFGKKPVTYSLMSKLYGLVSESERRSFREKLDELLSLGQEQI